MSLEDAAKLAREHADVCIDRGCHVVANALEGALAAERLAARWAATAGRHQRFGALVAGEQAVL